MDGLTARESPSPLAGTLGWSIYSTRRSTSSYCMLLSDISCYSILLYVLPQP